LAAIAVVLVFLVILSVKLVEHYRQEKARDSNRDRLA
jgi:hypothetical protein